MRRPRHLNGAAQGANHRSSGHECPRWKRCWPIPAPHGSAVPLHAMGKARARLSGAAAPPCGIALATRLCPSVGSSPVIQKGNARSKPCCGPIRRLLPKRASRRSGIVGPEKPRVRRAAPTWASKPNGTGPIWRASAAPRSCLASPAWWPWQESTCTAHGMRNEIRIFLKPLCRPVQRSHPVRTETEIPQPCGNRKRDPQAHVFLRENGVSNL